MNEKDYEDKKFHAAIQGIELDKEEDELDITSLKGFHAQEAGFGIGLGLGYVEV
jgi:hypothetical protein